MLGVKKQAAGNIPLSHYRNHSLWLRKKCVNPLLFGMGQVSVKLAGQAVQSRLTVPTLSISQKWQHLLARPPNFYDIVDTEIMTSRVRT